MNPERIRELEKQALAEQGLANFALKARLEATQEDNQRLRETVARVEALLGEWDAAPNPAPVLRGFRDLLRAALADPADPADIQPDDADVAYRASMHD